MVLRIITGKPDLVITDCQTQKDMKRLAGARSICLDAYGTDPIGKSMIWKFSGRIREQTRTEPVYLIERMNITTGKLFADREHILYVNGE